MTTDRDRLGLSTREAGWILTLSEPRVRRLLAQGLLQWVGGPGRIDPHSVRRMIQPDPTSALRHAAVTYVLAGRVSVPAPATRNATPISITELPRLIRT